MAESNTNYAALADTIKINDITSNNVNRDILQCLKDDKPFETLCIHPGPPSAGTSQDYYDYIPEDGEDIGWLGYYIGRNTKLHKLHFSKIIDNESFYKEMSRNNYMQKININNLDMSDGKMIHNLDYFFKTNQNLSEFQIVRCQFGIEGIRQLSLTIRNCNKSLKHFYLYETDMGDDLVDIITALSMHPQLTKFSLLDNVIGRNECTALATLLRCTTTKLQKLCLARDNIDDEGVKVLVNALADVNSLRDLSFTTNRSITMRGWRLVSTLLEMPECNLVALTINNNNIGNEGALVFANALANNSTLKCLGLHSCGIGTKGWAPFLKLLCDTSSVNSTYLSNHTLETISDMPRRFKQICLLVSNIWQDKRQVAMIKILKHHSHFNMEPFFEWEFKVLPLMIRWFTTAGTVNDYSITSNNSLRRMKLDCIYDFIKEFPMLYVEPVTRKEIAECIAWEERLQWLGEEDKLEEIRQRKARSMRRLGMK